MPSKYLNDARTGELIQKIYTADRAIATECKSYTDTNCLPLTGGTITGNLTVSGTITGDVTGNVTGNADSATNDANGNPIASTYLPLAGGTMTGAIHYVGANNRVFGVVAVANSTNCDIGWDWQNADGAILGLRSADQAGSDSGAFYLYARNGNGSCGLTGRANGSLTWNSKEVEQVNSKDSSYIRYESGLQICWGTYISTLSSGWTTITFPVAFKSGTTPAANINSSSGNSNYYAVNSLNNTSFKTGGASNPIHYVAVGYWK